MSKFIQRRALQLTVLILGLIPISAGLSGVLLGPSMAVGGITNISFDSHFRYLSGLLLGIGLGFWSTIPRIEKQSPLFMALTLIVFAGGMSRLVSLFVMGPPNVPMMVGLVMELIVTPLLCLWQFRVARAKALKRP